MDREPGVAPQRAPAKSVARRLIMDGDVWLVYERASAPMDRRSTPSLVFECRAVIRRVRDYPANWRELSDEELARLSWRR